MNTGYSLRNFDRDFTEGQVNVKYLLPETVAAKRLTALLGKQKFLAKICHLKSHGKKLQLIKRIEIFLNNELVEKTYTNLDKSKWRQFYFTDTKDPQ